MADDPRTLSTTKLLTGMVHDARDLFAAHVHELRNDVSVGLGDIKRALVSWATVVICAVLALQLWMATGIAALAAAGVSLWLAFGCAAGLATVVTVVFVARASAAGREVAHDVAAANSELVSGTKDAHWAAERAAETLTPP